jgi:predicted GNAT family acetyltransferase
VHGLRSWGKGAREARVPSLTRTPERHEMSTTDMHVIDDKQAGRFEIRAPEGTPLLQYVKRGRAVHLVHTEVPETMEGRGYGAALAKAALDAARAEGLQVVPTCPFVRTYIRRHPEYADLVAAEGARE